ncbi:Carbohydrate esterase 4 protein [Serendipita sp. 411]|nr:Carbohydrate esterase 4 protein [Serendipita sp. 411]
MLAVIPFFLLAASAVVAAPYTKRGLSQVVSNCNHDFSYSWDDGPYEWHDVINQEFSKANMKTTFFINGNNWRCIYNEPYVTMLRNSYKAGHQLASHTWGHKDVTSLTESEIDTQIGRLNDAFVRILGVKPKFFRPPYGKIDEKTATYIQEKWGLTILLWSDDSSDSVGKNTQKDSYDYYTGIASKSYNVARMTLSHETVEGSVLALQQGTVTNLVNAGIDLQTAATCLDMSPYEVVTGVFGERDDSWTCDGDEWIPATFVTQTSTTTTATGTSTSGTSTNTGTSISTSTTTTAATCAQTHTAASGDTCVKLGGRFGVTPEAIKAANSFIDCDNIWAWTPLCIPPGGTSSTTTATQTCVQTYTAGDNETCVKIANHFGLSEAAIRDANPYVNCNDIWRYTPVCIPPGGTSTTTSSAATSTSSQTCAQKYTADTGDTCAKIGNRFGLSEDAIRQANTFVNCSDIWKYTSICIPPGGSTQCKSTVTSQPGDNCQKLADRYHTTEALIKSWNSFLNCADVWAYTPITLYASC